jgi:radical SAM superfamily enzyme YgiQ (UPF0313 family)
MKVLFSNPPWWERKEGRLMKRRWRAGVRAGSRWPYTKLVHSRPDAFAFGDYLPYPFFMGYAATYARRATGADVRLRDSIALRESYRNYWRHLEEERYDWIVIESATPSWEHDAGVIRDIHRLLPEARIVVTGPITTTRAEEILERHPVHACIRGEYEKGIVRVLQGASGIIDFDLLTKEEMNAAPFPYFDDLHAHRYWDSNPITQIPPHAQIWSSRGCPFKCIFCVWPATMTGRDPDGEQARTVRHYTPEYMDAFIREIVGRYGFRSIYFDDDTFNLGNRHVLDMSAVMRRIGLPWSAMCRADTIKMETWKVMKESGCFGVKIGFESGNQQVVDTIVNKHLDLEYAGEVVHELKRLGMTVHGTFTYGLPGETRDQMQDTRRFIESLPFDTIQQSGTAEIEGTPMHTLRSRGSLRQYGGARIDDAYVQDADGGKKWQRLIQELRDN